MSCQLTEKDIQEILDNTIPDSDKEADVRTISLMFGVVISKISKEANIRIELLESKLKATHASNK